ncbi:MAG: hypothetical protein ABR589_13365, partial [Chthoniobacterales bacterium]
MNRIFLLSPAYAGGQRARMIVSENAQFDLARRLRSGDLPSLGEVFTFLSGLYFRGKLAYANAFADPAARLAFANFRNIPPPSHAAKIVSARRRNRRAGRPPYPRDGHLPHPARWTVLRSAVHLKSPLPPMEARSVDEIPLGGEWQYEPKWDGFRCLAFRDGDEIYLQSKAGQPLARYFPDVVEALRALPPTRFILDGELVI